jgi:hypothetical protein
MRHLLLHELLNQGCQLLLVLKTKLLRVNHGVQLLLWAFEAPKHEALDFLPLSLLMAEEYLIWLGEMPTTIDVYRYKGVEVPVTLDEEYLSFSHSDSVSLPILPRIQVRNRCPDSGRHIPTEADLTFLHII